MREKALKSLVLCLLAALGLPTLAQVYKWVDDKGITHYGERPPTGANARQMAKEPASPAPAAAAQPTWQEQERAFRQRRVEAAQAEARTREQEQANRQACNQARDQLRQYKAAGALYHLDAQGERAILSDAERQAATSRLEQLVAQNCR